MVVSDGVNTNTMVVTTTLIIIITSCLLSDQTDASEWRPDCDLGGMSLS